MELKLYGGLQTQLTHQRSSIPQAAFEDNLAVAECMNGHAPNQGRLAVGRQAEVIRSVVNFPRPLQAAASFIPMLAGRVEIMFRSEERRLGKECVRRVRVRVETVHKK